MFAWYWRMPLEFAPAELWLAKGDLAQARPQAESFLKIALATAEHTWQALTWEVNVRVGMAELDLTRARVLFNHLQKSECSQLVAWGLERPNLGLLACRRLRQMSDSASEAPTLFPAANRWASLSYYDCKCLP